MPIRRLLKAMGYREQFGSVEIIADQLQTDRQLGAHTVLDADAEALAVGLTGRPHLVKSNHHEAERLLGRSLGTDAALLKAAEELRKGGASTAVITAGRRGAVAPGERQPRWAWLVVPGSTSPRCSTVSPPAGVVRVLVVEGGYLVKTGVSSRRDHGVEVHAEDGPRDPRAAAAQ